VDSAASIPRELDDDGQLVRAACDGNAQAFDQLVQRHAGRLLRMVRNLTSSREDAEDVIQEAFASAYFKLDSFAGRASFFTWLYRIALNKAISRRRKRRIETAMKAQNLDDTQPSDSERASPEMVVEQAEQVNRLREAIARLEPDRQSVLVLRDVDGKDYSEIAEILNVPVGTVRSRLHRARCDLKQILEADASPLRGGLRS
jgi:RNA polymerase sigma-70 factor (ECF subfamily)